ncbi:class C sortase [Corynebacterium sp. L4756]|uniref:class C sortase n=1 Tax=unclassified Corynebacterium TaxID=2624378 RepID=UPI00374DB0C6
MVAVTQKRRINWNTVIALALVVVGLSVLLYPVVATQWNNAMQRLAADEYSEIEQGTPPEILNSAVEDAHQYNAEMSGIEIIDAWDGHVDKSSPGYQRYLNYLSQLSGTEAMGQIAIPAIDSNLPVFHGTSDEVLNKGVGHLYGTDLPVGGENRHAVLSAHTGLPHATLWDNLEHLEVGDVFYMSVSGQKMKYEIGQIEIVLPHESQGLKRVPGEDLVTLVTCTPYGINTHRILVTGHRVPMDEQESDVFDQRGIQIQWWMWLILAVAIVCAILTAWWLYSLRKKNRKKSGPNGTTEGQQPVSA